MYLISETAEGDYPVSDETESFYKSVVEKYNSGADVSAQGKALNPNHNAYGGFSSTNIYLGIRATAYLCDTEVWDKYTDAEGKADFAMGGPSKKLFKDSYNAYQESINETNINNKIYRLKSSGYWVLTTSSYNQEDNLLAVLEDKDYVGEIRIGLSNCFARPIVCIPVSNFNYTLE